MLVLMVSPVFVSILAIAALRLVMVTAQSPERVRLLLWGYTLVAVGEVTMVGRMTLYASAFMVVANVMMLVGMVLVAQGARQTVGTPVRSSTPLVVGAAITLPYIVLAGLPEWSGLRLVMGSVVAASIHLWAAAPLLRCELGRYTPVARGAGAFFLLASAVLLLRGSLVLLLPASSDPFDPSVTVNVAMFVTLNIMKLFTVVAVGLLIAARLMLEAEQVSERIQRERDRFELILSKVPGVVWEADARTIDFSFVSAQSLDVLGYRPEQWLESGFWESKIHPDDRDDAIAFCKERTAKLEAHEFQYRFFNSNNEVVWLHDAVAVVAENGEPKWLRGVMVDITELKVLETNLRRSVAKAEAADRSKSMFLAHMSHEIRTPMNGVLAMLQLALRQVPPGSLRDDLEVAELSSIALMDLLRDILDLTRIESGSLAIHAVPVATGALFETVIALHGQTARNRGLSCILDLDPSVPTYVLLDGPRLTQVLNNLLSNAVKFTPAGEVRMDVRWSETEEELRIVVTDTGPGIAIEMSELVFQVFEQPDTELATRHGGTGLGLSISRSLAQALGGSLTLVQRDGPGACFELRVPAPRSHTPQPSKSVEARPRRGVRALVVEDNAVNQRVMSAILEAFGVRVVVVGSGEEALGLLTGDAQFDVIFMDIGLPGIDGYETTRALRQRPYLDDVPVLALTAAAFDEHRREAVRSGMQDFLTKPVQLRDLQRALERWCGPRGGSTSDPEVGGDPPRDAPVSQNDG